MTKKNYKSIGADFKDNDKDTAIYDVVSGYETNKIN